MWDSFTDNGQEVTEDTLEYFNRFVAGDRK
jgi:hypothetical protein